MTVNGATSAPLRFAMTATNPNLFVMPDSYQTIAQDFFAVARNEDGSMDAATNPARNMAHLFAGAFGLCRNSTGHRVPIWAAQFGSSATRKLKRRRIR